MIRFLFAVVLVATTATAFAQIAEVETPEGPVRYSEATVTQFKAGAEITASRGGVRNVRVMVAVPLECAEQEVTIVEEDFSRDVGKVRYRVIDGGARQMLIHIPQLQAGATARAVVTFEVRNRKILPPFDDIKTKLVIPKKPPREVRKFLAESPYIEARDKRIRSVAGEIWKSAESSETPDPNTWQRVEALYDYMLDNIQYVEESEDKSAINTLRDGHADCHGRSAFFIALCRANDVPARVVWVNNHCFAEFYLENDEGEGFWFPAESAGTRAFGEMPLARPVLQKGDNFKVPERPRDRLRYASDYIVGVPMPGSGQPRAKFIREHIE